MADVDSLMKAGATSALQSRFVFSPGKVAVRGLVTLKLSQQLENLTDWLNKMSRRCRSRFWRRSQVLNA